MMSTVGVRVEMDARDHNGVCFGSHRGRQTPLVFCDWVRPLSGGRISRHLVTTVRPLAVLQVIGLGTSRPKGLLDGVVTMGALRSKRFYYSAGTME